MNIIVCDLETTGLDPSKDRIVEVAGILVDIELATASVHFASLVNGPDNAAESVNRIPAPALHRAPPLQYALNRLSDLVDFAGDDAVFLAHRAEFDRGFLAAAAPILAERLPWVCSKFDIEWPCSKPGASCVEVALAHGVPVVKAHRALTDRELLASTICSVAKTHDMGALIRRALQPKSLFVADTPKPWEMADGEWPRLKAQLVDAGFRFEGAAKRWERRMRAEEATGLPFSVREVA